MAETNYSSTAFTGYDPSSLPSWADTFSAPSVAPYQPQSSFDSFSFDPSVGYSSGFNFASESAPQSTGGSNWMDWVKAAGLGMSAAGDAIRAYRGEPVSPNSPFQQYLAQEQEKQERSRMEDLLKEILKPKTTDAPEDVLDPAADAEAKSYFSVPTLQSLKPSIGGMRMAGSVFPV